MDYLFAKPEHWDDLLDFVNLIFSQVRVPHDFRELIPKAYETESLRDVPHAIAVENGRVRGCVAVYPLPLAVAGERVRMGYVGSVSVHKSARGAGVMTRLMQMQLARAQAEGLDALVLGGQRQRYEHFGFAPCGGAYRYTVCEANLRHLPKMSETDAVTFAPLEDGSAGADYAFALYSALPVTGARPRERFATALKTWKAHPKLVLWGQQKLGYLVASRDDAALTELVLEDIRQAPAVLGAWMRANRLKTLEIEAATYETALNRELARYAEGYTLSSSVSLRLLRPEALVRAYLKLKNQLAPLSDGTLRLKLGDAPPVRLTVQGGETQVSATDEADFALSALEAVPFLFGFNRFYAPQPNRAAPPDWFPLPLHIPEADQF